MICQGYLKERNLQELSISLNTLIILTIMTWSLVRSRISIFSRVEKATRVHTDVTWDRDMFRCPGSKQQIVVQINQFINPFLTGTVVITSQVSSAQLSSSPPGTGTAEPVPKKTTRSMRAMRFCDFPAAAPDTTTWLHAKHHVLPEMAWNGGWCYFLALGWSRHSLYKPTDRKSDLQLQVALEPQIRQYIVVSLSRLNHLRCELPVVNNDWKVPKDVVDLIVWGKKHLPNIPV